MGNNNSALHHIKIVREIISGLAKIRLEQGAWLDSESEEVASESQVFKIGECLYPFYLVAKEAVAENGSPLPPETLLNDTKLFFKHVAKDGFFPNPYSQI